MQQELASGQVAVRIAFQDDGSRMRVHAAVKVHATPETIWRVLTDCEHAPNFVPGVKRCHRERSAPDRSWDVVEQEAKYSWLMPPITCVIRAEYKPPQRIDFPGFWIPRVLLRHSLRTELPAALEAVRTRSRH